MKTTSVCHYPAYRSNRLTLPALRHGSAADNFPSVVTVGCSAPAVGHGSADGNLPSEVTVGSSAPVAMSVTVATSQSVAPNTLPAETNTAIVTNRSESSIASTFIATTANRSSCHIVANK